MFATNIRSDRAMQYSERVKFNYQVFTLYMYVTHKLELLAVNMLQSLDQRLTVMNLHYTHQDGAGRKLFN